MCASRARGTAQQDDASDDAAAAAASGSAAAHLDPAHRCGICGKAFERRDLRDRHRRRCVHTFTKPKRSKRRSCLACAASKLGCDQEQPSCRRCLDRNIACEYVGSGEPADAESAGPQETANSVVVDGNGIGTVNQILASLGDDNTAILEIDRLAGGDKSASMEYATHEAFLFSGDDMYWSHSQLDRNDIAFTSLWGNMGGAHDAPLCHTRHNDSHTPASPVRSRDAALSPEKMVNVILGYLPMMVSREPPAPPFIHDQIYRCGDGDVKEPIARAMVCISAHTGAMPSGRSFVHEMINTERGRLIKSFQHCTSETDMLAVLHAMIVYQALGLFSESAKQVRDGELHQPFLLKMVRKVAQKYRKDLVHDPTSPAPLGWRQWSFTETLRRTIFLAHAINVLSARLAKQDPFFYEALDGDLVLDMPLPAPAAMWDAATEGQWLSVRASVPWIPRTGRMGQGGKVAATEDDDAFTRIIIQTLFEDGLPDTRGF